MNNDETYTPCTSCGRPMRYCKGQCCGKTKGCQCQEYCGKACGAIRPGEPKCPPQAVIPSLTVESVSNLKDLADCFVHVSDINTTFYIDDKHRIMTTWAGLVSVEDYDFEANPLNLRGQIAYDSKNNTAAIYDKQGANYIFQISDINNDYMLLENKPQINGVTLEGNKTSADLGIPDVDEVAIVFDTVAEMKQATNLVNGSYARTLGFHTANDGGGALYKITDTGTANEMDVIAVGGLFAVLCPINATITIKQFGSLTTEDNTAILQEAINFGIAHKCKLIINSDVNINTLGRDLITITGDIEIDGNHQKFYNNVIGDYHSVFLITGKVDIKNLTLVDYKNNAPTAQTGIVDDTDRIDFYLRECTDSNFENITINNCLGIWQFICVRCENVNIKNNIINYNDAYTVNYDRTSMYLNGANIICENNLLNGVSKGRTGIESHGDNIVIKNNRILGYRSPIYIVNDETVLYDKIHQVNVIGNYCETERGLCIWLEANEDVDTINILDNTIITSGDWYGLHTYDVLGENFTVKNINIKNNVIKHLGTTTKETFRFSPTQVGTNKNVTFEHITIADNDITEGGTGYTFELYDQLDGVSFGSIIVKNNTMTLNSNTLAHYVSTAGRINNVLFDSNIIKNNGTSLAIVSITTRVGDIIFKDNTIEKPLTVIIGGSESVNSKVYGKLPIDLTTLTYRPNLYDLNITDVKGNIAKKSNGVILFTLYNKAVLSGNQYRRGDIIWNTEPSIGNPIGWVSISNNDNFRIIQNILGGV